MLALRSAWKDWGFAPLTFRQAQRFIKLAKADTSEVDRTAHIRAAIVFALMAFEADFYEVIRGFLQENNLTLDPNKVQKIEKRFAKRAGITEAVKTWPQILTEKPLGKTSTEYVDLLNAIEYRNALVHGKITEKIPSFGKLAQDLETINYAEIVVNAVGEMVKVVARHFGFKVPSWV